MNILFNKAISEVAIYPKRVVHNTYDIRKSVIFIDSFILFIIPVFKKISNAVVTEYGRRYICKADEFTHEKMYLENGIFYFKPHCEIILNTKKRHSVFFDTIEELNIYIENLTSSAPHITIN